jgi:aspartyl-tRNA(Asn)/glutamyl-tRNA(Gln) amidotransferase subunit B
MLEPGDIVSALIDRRLAGRRVLITAGPTFEDLDPVRFLGNRSSGRMADEIVAAEGLAQIGDEGALLSSVRAVIDANQDAVGQIRGGKTGTIGFLVGQVMKATAGKANPKLVNELLRRELNI